MIEPMLCKPAKPFDSEEYIFEPKMDGIRCIGMTDSSARLFSRSGRDITVQFPEIALPAGSMILDGELVCLNGGGIPSFNHIQHRITRSAVPKLIAERYPVQYYVFDILEYNGENLMSMTLLDRKRVLDAIPDMPRIIKVQSVIGSGISSFNTFTAAGWEGVVGKHIRSLYVPGARSKHWLKSKGFHEDSFQVCGITAGEGNREGKIGALVLGRVIGTRMIHVGEAGSGLTQDDLDSLSKRLHVGSCPFLQEPDVDKLTCWTIPDLVVEVQYLEISAAGKLRNPSIKRILW